jgi:hypothetical protein
MGKERSGWERVRDLCIGDDLVSSSQQAYFRPRMTPGPRNTYSHIFDVYISSIRTFSRTPTS